MTNETLVIGATGNIGRHVVTGLRERGASVRAMSRFPGPATVAADLSRPSTLHAALSGVDSVFLLWPFLSSDGAAEVVDVVAQHARRVVYVSALHVRDDRTPEENGTWGRVEDAIRRSGLEWTFLRPGGFAANTREWAAEIRAGGPVRLFHPDAARSLIHERDIADVAVLALTEDGHAGKAYPLTGPAALTQSEQVRILAEVAGQRAEVEEITPEAARANILTWATEEFADATLAYFETLVSTPEPVTTTVTDLTGRPARTFEQWARDHADDFRPLSPTQVAERYVAAFRTGRMDQAMRLTAPDVVRVAPLENDGEHVELRGLPAITANAERLNGDLEFHGLEVDGPYVLDDRFAVRFTFDETHTPTGRRGTTAKMSLYTVTDGMITREEVHYFDPAARG